MSEKCYNWQKLFQGGNCKLVETSNGQTGRYAALSYCWGASLPSTTTTTNLQARKSAISFNTLPRTLQDAISIVRWMGIEYIWIDCLCILQDSKADWEHEAARMADVYSNAYLTIAASRAEHCEEGFIGHRTVSPSFYIDIDDHDGSFELYFQRFSIPEDENSQPLELRAWAAQERVLSNRILGFNEDRMIWECNQIYQKEESIEDQSSVLIPNNRLESMAESLGQYSSEPFAISQWTYFVESYSARQVTYEIDTFPAISGVIQKVQQITGDMYYAGLWKQHFLEGLLWRPEMRLASRKRVEGHPQIPRRRHEWIAPSWSWASVKGKITHMYSHDIEYCACLEECSVTQSGIDPFGALKEGFARLTGPVTLITDFQAEDEFQEYSAPNCIVQLSKGTSTGGTVYFDFFHRTSCDVLMITTRYGICIEKVEHTTNTYVRIGVVQTWSLPNTGDKVIYDDLGDPVETEQWRSPTTSDHVPPRSIILV